MTKNIKREIAVVPTPRHQVAVVTQHRPPSVKQADEEEGRGEG